MSVNKKDTVHIGWKEWVALPELKLPAILAKVDTGASTSALHAFMVEKFEDNGLKKVRFGIHPIPERPEIEVYCTAHLVEERKITSSNQQTELRYVIRTTAQFGKHAWPIEITLTNREEMSSRMLIGRSAMAGRLIVVPEASFLLGELSPDLYEISEGEEKGRSLHICILSREADSYSTERLASAAEGRGHRVDILNTTKCYVDISASHQSIHYNGRVLPRYDAVIPRIGASITKYGLAVVRQFESLGTYALNGSRGIEQSRDKLLAHQILAQCGVPMPITAFGRSMADAKDIIKIVQGVPLVLKLLQGSQGESVILAETTKAAKAVMTAFRGLGVDFIAQEYIKESSGADVRVIVLDNKVIAAMERRSEEGDFRSNIHQGGTAHKTQLSAEERKEAIKAARGLGLKFAGVDLLRSKSGPKVIECNSSPGLKGIEGITKLDIAGRVIKFIEENAKPRLPRRIVKHDNT